MFFLIIITLVFVNESVGAVNNVLFVMFDDLRPELGAYNGAAKTEHMDSVAKQGIQFQNAFAQLALCGPSRNSMLTSRRPDSLRLYDFTSYWRTAAGNFTTLPQYLKQSGYDTYSVGKIFHPGIPSNFTDDFPLSWSEPVWHPPSLNFERSRVCYSNGTLGVNLLCPVQLPEQPTQTLPDIESTKKAISFLNSRKKSDKPFFLGLGYHKPHIPFRVPWKYLGRTDAYPLDEIDVPSVRTVPAGLPEVAWNPWNDLRARDDIAALNVSYPYGPFTDDWVRRIRQSYYASISYVDELFGTVLKSLKESGLENNTVIVVMGDHGWSLGEHGEWAKYSLYEKALRTPLIIKCPRLASGSVISDPVELVDLFPTLVDILGLPKIPTCVKNSDFEELCTEGRSLMPLIWKKNDKKKGVAYSQYPRPGVTSTVHPDSDNPDLGDITVMGYSVRTEQYRYNLWVSWKNFTPKWDDVKGVELYDHAIDPDENSNLAGKTSSLELEKKLKEMLLKQFSREATEKGTDFAAVVDLNTVLHETNKKFLSFGLDTSFVKKTLPNLTEENWKKLNEVSQNLSPAILRLGGTDADRLFFSENPKSGFVGLTPDDWAKFNLYLNRSNLTMLFDFNVLLRDGQNWDSSNAQEILEVTKTDGFPISHFQLGNEPNSFPHVFNVSISPEQLGEDFKKLGKLLDLYDFYNNSLLIGPDVTNPRLKDLEISSTKAPPTTNIDPTHHTISSALTKSMTDPNIKKLTTPTLKRLRRESLETTTKNNTLKQPTNENCTLEVETPPVAYLKRFLNTTVTHLDAVSWHHYYLNGKTSKVEDFLNPETMDSLVKQITAIKSVVRDASKTVAIWLTETGSAYGGGAANISDKYASIFLFLDKLGISAKFGIDLVMRQSLYGGHYALLGPDFEPNPDFWISLVFKKLVGNRVYNVSTESTNKLVRLYAHSVLPTKCLKNPDLESSLVVFGMNLGKEKLNIDIKGTSELTLCASFVFSPSKSGLQSSEIALNNRLLVWKEMKPKMNSFIKDLASLEDIKMLSGHSVAFWVFSSPQF